MRLAAGLFLVSRFAWGLTCGDDLPACERFPSARAVFTGTVVQGNAPGHPGLLRGTLFLVRVGVAFKGLSVDEREVLVDAGTYSEYRVGEVYLFYAGRKDAATVVERKGYHRPWPAQWAGKRNWKVYAVGICGGSKEMARAGKDLQWIRRALRENMATRVFGATYQIYSSLETRFNTGSNVPLEGATVWLRGRGVEHSIKSGVEGVFEFTGIAPGEYRLWAAREPWKESYRETIEVVPGGCVERALRLEPAGTISGVVKGANGRPVKDVRVELVRELADGKLPKEDSLGAVTDAEGKFIMEGAPAGRFLLGVNLTREIDADGAWPATYFPGKVRREEATVLELAPNGHLRDLRLSLPPTLPTRTVRIRVLWADGSAAVGAEVLAKPTTSTARFHFPTEAKGSNVVTLRLMQHFAYRLRASWDRLLRPPKESQRVESEEITLPPGKRDIVLDMRLSSNRPE